MEIRNQQERKNEIRNRWLPQSGSVVSGMGKTSFGENRPVES